MSRQQSLDSYKEAGLADPIGPPYRRLEPAVRSQGDDERGDLMPRAAGREVDQGVVHTILHAAAEFAAAVERVACDR